MEGGGEIQQKVSNKCNMHVLKPHVKNFIRQLEVITRAYADYNILLKLEAFNKRSIVFPIAFELHRTPPFYSIKEASYIKNTDMTKTSRPQYLLIGSEC